MSTTHDLVAAFCSGQPRVYNIDTPEITAGLQFAATTVTYRIETVVADFGRGVFYVQARKLSGTYAGNDTYLRVRAIPRES